MSDLAINTSLLVAALDLNLVKLLRQAIRTADLTSAAAAGHAVTPPSVVQASERTITRASSAPSHQQPAATFEPSNQIHHWHTCTDTGTGECQPCSATPPVPATEFKSGIEAPWKVLPWPTAAKPVLPPGHRVIKVQPNRADICDIGRTLDLFV